MDTYEPIPHDVELGLLAEIEGPAEIRCFYCGEDVDACDCESDAPDREGGEA